MASVNSGTRGRLDVNASATSNAAGNFSDVSWNVQWVERSLTTAFNNNGVPFSVVVGGIGTVASGNFTFDWRPSGFQSQQLASGTTRVFHNSDGSAASSLGNVTGSVGDTGSDAAGRGVSVTQGVSLPVLKVVPGVPSSVVATRISDTSVSVSWSQSSASNGQPTSNTIRRSVNGGSFADVVTISPATSATLAAAANQKLVYGVRATNTAGASAFSASSTARYTTPAAPSSVVAAKTAALNIDVSWTPNVAYVEHQHVVEFSTNAGSSWSALATVAAGVSTHTHVNPNAAFVHVYRVRAVTTASPILSSGNVTSNSVQLLTAPNAPTLAALPANANRQAAFVVTWAHNPVDTTAQTAFEVNFSANGGSTWTSTGKVTSVVSSRTIAANTYAANQSVTVRVRTWGQATSGGSDGTGASVYSTSNTVTFKTLPTATIVSPASGVNYTESTLDVQLNFAQAEGAVFVSAQIALLEGATVLESIVSNTLASTLLDTTVDDGSAYSVQVTVTDSNGLTSTLVTRSFTVAYTLPVTAGVTVEYLPDSGIVQVGLTFPTAGGGRVAATTVTVFRTIGGVRETVASRFPITGGTLTILDTTPTINGVNGYTVRTFSNDGATANATATVTTNEGDMAFLSSGPGFAEIVKFQSNLRVAATGAREQELVRAAGRVSPIALFGPAKSLQVSGSATLFAGDESTPQDVEAFIRAAGVCCYRDGTGRRMFGIVAGSIETVSARQSELQFTVTEAT